MTAARTSIAVVIVQEGIIGRPSQVPHRAQPVPNGKGHSTPLGPRLAATEAGRHPPDLHQVGRRGPFPHHVQPRSPLRPTHEVQVGEARGRGGQGADADGRIHHRPALCQQAVEAVDGAARVHEQVSPGPSGQAVEGREEHRLLWAGADTWQHLGGDGAHLDLRLLQPRGQGQPWLRLRVLT